MLWSVVSFIVSAHQLGTPGSTTRTAIRPAASDKPPELTFVDEATFRATFAFSPRHVGREEGTRRHQTDPGFPAELAEPSPCAPHNNLLFAQFSPFILRSVVRVLQFDPNRLVRLGSKSSGNETV